MSAAVLHVDGLSVRVAGTGRPIVRNVCLEVGQGETVCVVGESGSGKSVTALSAMGLLADGALEVTGGRILVDGEDVLRARPHDLRRMRGESMAMVFQEPMTALNPVMRVSDQIDEVLRIHTRLGKVARRERVLAMLEAVQLPDIGRIYNSYPHELSGGQRQRIAIAMALILKPRLLIADEPTTALDVTTQKQILSLIRDLQRQNDTAVLFITHDLGVVAEIADRIVVMNRGKVVETGTRTDILARPREPYTRTLVSSVPSLVPRPARTLGTETAMRVVDLNKTYTGKRLLGRRPTVSAVNDVSLELRRGEIVGVVGESGSGKSTLARCIMRLIEPTSGDILVSGANLSKSRESILRPLRRHVQMVFQDPYRSLNPRLHVGVSLIEGLVNFGTPRASAEAKAADLLSIVGLPAEAMQRYPHQFSGGQRQRICIARALALEPDVLIADEAVSALDVSVQAQVLRLFEEIRDRTGTAILFITHDLRTAAQICDTIVVMEKGRVVESGSAAAVLTRPRHPYTLSLIDAAPGRGWNFQKFRPTDPAIVSARSGAEETSSAKYS